MKTLQIKFLIPAVSIILCIGVFEFVLRIYPSLIPPSHFINYNKDLRKEIAKKNNYSISDQYSYLIRDDDGPMMKIIRPLEKIKINLDKIDVGEGGIEFVQMDENGLCNKSVPLSASIIVLGDSFVWCFGVLPEATWSRKLGSELHRSTYNISKPGSGPHEYIQMYKKFGRMLNPDLVILNIYGGNDLTSVISYRNWPGATTYLNIREQKELEAYRDPSDPRPRGSIAPPSLGVYLNNHTFMKYSYSLSFIWRGLIDALEPIKLKYLYYKFITLFNESYDVPPGQRPKVNFKYSVKVGNNRVPFNIFNGDQDEIRSAKKINKNRSELEAYRDAIYRYSELAKTDNFIPVICYLPSAYIAYASSAEFEDDEIFKLLIEFNSLQKEFIKKVAQEYSVKFIDVTDGLRKSSDLESEPLYFPGNVHLTTLGHASVAKAIAASLRKLNLDLPRNGQ